MDQDLMRRIQAAKCPQFAEALRGMVEDACAERLAPADLPAVLAAADGALYQVNNQVAAGGGFFASDAERGAAAAAAKEAFVYRVLLQTHLDAAEGKPVFGPARLEGDGEAGWGVMVTVGTESYLIEDCRADDAYGAALAADGFRRCFSEREQGDRLRSASRTRFWPAQMIQGRWGIASADAAPRSWASITEDHDARPSYRELMQRFAS